MARFINPERFLCFRLEKGLTIAACLEAAVCLGLIIVHSTSDQHIQLNDGRVLDLSTILTPIIIQFVIVVFLIVGVALRNRYCIIPWMIMTTVVLCIASLLLLPFVFLVCIVFGPFVYALYRAKCTFELFEHYKRDNNLIELEKTLV